MLDDNQNTNIPRFDSQTGEPLNYDYNQTDNSNEAQQAEFQQPQYTYYNTESTQQPKTARQIKQEKKALRKEAKKAAKREGGGPGYVVKLLISAIVFGMVAGTVMFGVNRLGDRLDPQKSDINDVQIPMVSDPVGNDSTDIVNQGVIQTEGMSISNPMNVQSVVRAAMPSIVAINGKVAYSGSTPYGYPFGGTQREASTSGTGIIVGKNDTELLIVTNAHVVDGVSNLTCTFDDGEQVNVTVKGSKSNKDIAVVAASLSDIKSSTLSSIAIAKLGDSDGLELGQQVVAIGNALGEGQSVTVGYVSALNRSITIEGTEYSNLIMTDAAINPGNSGGALLDASGAVIGINSAKYSSEEVEGMGYAIPISSIRDVLDNLMNRQTRDKVSADKASYLGISGVDVTSAFSKAYGYPQGILIQQVQSGSPAAKAGLAKNDIIVGFDGDSVSSFNELKTMMLYYAEGEKVVIDYYHMESGEYRLKSTEVTLGHNK